MSETPDRHRVNITLSRPGCPPEAVDQFYTVGRKPEGGFIVRLMALDNFVLEPSDTLIFDFTVEKSEPIAPI